MSGHTPGPWGIFNIDNYTIGECENTKTLGRVIAVTAHHSVNPFYGIENEEAKANARLVAAAPDLLAACKEAEQKFRVETETYKMLVAAIAKAEGGS